MIAPHKTGNFSPKKTIQKNGTAGWTLGPGLHISAGNEFGGDRPVSVKIRQWDPGRRNKEKKILGEEKKKIFFFFFLGGEG